MGIAPEETMEDAQKEMEAWMKKLPEKDEWFKKHPVKVEWYGARWVPGAIETEHPVVSALMKNFKSIMEKDAELIIIPGEQMEDY